MGLDTMVTQQRRALFAAIARHSALSTYCARIDQEIEAKEAAVGDTASRERAEAQQALEKARRTASTPEQRALSAVLQTPQRPVQTVEEAQAALDGLRAKHDAMYEPIHLAKREAHRIRHADLAAATRQRDQAVGEVLVSENVVADLLHRYNSARVEMGRLYLAIAALPLLIRPGGQWQSGVSLNELQTGDKSLANDIKDTIAALQSDPGAPLPNSPQPQPQPDAEAA
jgi:hypothetical protein